MSEIDIVLLGMLKKKSQSAYDLKKEVEFRSISHWVKISSPSIFKNLKELEKKGYIQGKSIQNTKLPPKVIYSITDTGNQYFLKEMIHLSKNEVRLFQSMNAVILNMDLLSDEQQCECMNNIYDQIKVLKEYFETKMSGMKDVPIPLSGQLIIEQQRELITVLDNWVIEAKKKIDGGKPE